MSRQSRISPRLQSLRKTQAGFTLIEVVVAVAVLAISLTVIYESFGWSLRRASTVQQQQVAWLAAQSVLTAVRGQHVLAVGQRSGKINQQVMWSTEIDRYPLPISSASQYKMFAVKVIVTWGEKPSQQIQLNSVEIAKEAA